MTGMATWSAVPVATAVPMVTDGWTGTTVVVVELGVVVVELGVVVVELGVVVDDEDVVLEVVELDDVVVDDEEEDDELEDGTVGWVVGRVVCDAGGHTTGPVVGDVGSDVGVVERVVVPPPDVPPGLVDAGPAGPAGACPASPAVVGAS